MKLMERMKVCASTKRLLLLCCCFIISTGQKCDRSSSEGSSITLPLANEGLSSIQQLIWKHNDSVLVSRKRGVFSKGAQKDIDSSGSLKLTDLKKTSSGKYISEVFDAEGQIVQSLAKTWNLCVTDRVPKPSVTHTCKKIPGSPVTWSITLTCNISQPQPKDLSFKWSENGKEIGKQTQKTLEKQKPGRNLTCTVSNPGGSETSPSVIPTCHEERTSIFPEQLFGFEFWTMVGILASGGALLLTLLIITICCCSRARRRKRKMLIEEGELRLDWTNQQQQQLQQPHQHHHNHQQPAGHTGPKQQRSKPAQERERTRVVDPDAPNLPKPRGGTAAADPDAPKLPKPRGGDPSAPKLPKTRGGDPSVPKLPKPRGGDPSAPKLPDTQGGDLVVPKLPNARGSPRLPTAEVDDPFSMDEGAPLGPRPAGTRPGDPPMGDGPMGPRPGDSPQGPRPANATDEEQAPPLPQPRKKVPKAQRRGPDPYAGLQ